MKDVTEIATLKAISYINKKVNRISLSCYYEDCPLFTKGWYIMITPEFKKSGKYTHNISDGFCFLIVKDNEKTEQCYQKSINNAVDCSKRMIKKYMMEIEL